MRIAILGFGREGRTTLDFLRKSRQYKNDEFWVIDKKSTIKISQKIHRQLGKDYLKNLERFDLIFRSPGVPYNLPELVKTRRVGVRLSSATKLFFRELNHLPFTNNHLPMVVGITGTKGKGTIATLLYKILNVHLTSPGQAGKKVFLAGNVGVPALNILPRLSVSIPHGSVVVLELSSFQLQDLEMSPRIAVLSDIFPDHQDKHLSLKEYYAAKANISRHQKQGDKIFYFSENKESRKAAMFGGGKKIAVSPKKFKLFGESDLKVTGYHNFKNAAMAATVAGHLGIPAKTIIKTIKNFRGLPHRLQHLKKINRIDFYNDSAAVNPGATIAAIEALCDKRQETRDKEKLGGVEKKTFLSHAACPMSLILIAGGLERGLDYSGLAKAIKKHVKAVVLYGENKKEIAKAVKRQETRDKRQGELKVAVANTLKEAIKIAYRYALSLVAGRLSHVAILFSPASASFDMFRNYEERGIVFIKEVKKIIN